MPLDSSGRGTRRRMKPDWTATTTTQQALKLPAPFLRDSSDFRALPGIAARSPHHSFATSKANLAAVTRGHEGQDGLPVNGVRKSVRSVCRKGIRWLDEVLCSTAVDLDLPVSTTLQMWDVTERDERERDDSPEVPPAVGEQVDRIEMPAT